MTWKKHID